MPKYCYVSWAEYCNKCTDTPFSWASGEWAERLWPDSPATFSPTLSTTWKIKTWTLSKIGTNISRKSSSMSLLKTSLFSFLSTKPISSSPKCFKTSICYSTPEKYLPSSYQTKRSNSYLISKTLFQNSNKTNAIIYTISSSNRPELIYILFSVSLQSATLSKTLSKTTPL